MEFNKAYWRKAAKNETLSSQENITDQQIDDFFNRIELLDAWQKAKTVALYCSLPDEISTTRVIDKWSKLKKILLPVVCESEMDFYEYDSGCEFCNGAFGILEPKSDKIVTPDVIDLVIVPGVLFDKSGCRLGRGKGYYDKYLKICTAYKIGVGLDSQIVESLPSEEHDVRMDLVLPLL